MTTPTPTPTPKPTPTLGPWTYSKADALDDWDWEVVGNEADGPHLLAGVFCTAASIGDLTSDGEPINDGEANARLMAAAWDLLAACEMDAAQWELWRHDSYCGDSTAAEEERCRKALHDLCRSHGWDGKGLIRQFIHEFAASAIARAKGEVP